MPTEEADREEAMIMETITTAVALKQHLLKHGKTSIEHECPRCGGILHGRLVGSRNHLRMACTGACGMAMME